MEEKVHITKTCRMSGKKVNIMKRDLKYYELLSPTFAGKTIPIPLPTITPACRQQRKLAHGNLNKLYLRPCDLTGEEMLSLHAPSSPHTVYNNEYRLGDDWDAIEYAIAFDFKRPFFEQYYELSKRVPWPATIMFNSEDCEYCNAGSNNTNCYHSFRVHECDYVLYSYRPNNCRNCVDCYQITDSDYLYECVYTHNSSYSTYLYRSSNIDHSEFLLNCHSCNNCFPMS